MSININSETLKIYRREIRKTQKWLNDMVYDCFQVPEEARKYTYKGKDIVMPHKVTNWRKELKCT